MELYRGQPLYYDIAAYLAAHGYRLWNLYALVRNGDELVSADALFVPC